MADSVSPRATRSTPDVKSLTTHYSNYLWNRLVSFFPNSNSPLLGRISNFFRQASRARSRTRKCFLPLPLPSKSVDSSAVMTEASRIFDVLEDILECVFLNLHVVQKNLLFWQSKAESSNAQKACFMVLERGPQAFIDESFQLIQNFVTEDSSMQKLCHSASSHISKRIAVLNSLRNALAKFLAQVYIEIESYGEHLIADPHKSLSLLLTTLNGLFSSLEASISSLQMDSFVGGSCSLSLMFDKLPEVNQEGSQWTDCEIKDAINLTYLNLQKLDSHLSTLVSVHRKPRKMARYWVRYTCGAVGISVCSLWLLRHSSLVGSPDIDNWVREAKESTVSFWNDHVEKPLLSIRDDLFETFRRRDKGVMELAEVQLTANSLRSMLLAFCKQTEGKSVPDDASDQELLEIVMARYEKELMHPIQNLLGGELARGLLIQVQKLKLDIETAMLELDQILKANEINFAILAALPAFFLSLLLLMVVRSWFKQDKGAEGRGRIARLQRRLLIVDVERRIRQYQSCVDQGQDQDAQCMFGLVLYSLDRLYRSVERHAKITGEWLYLRQEIIDLGKSGLSTEYKLEITSRMERVYDCLLPYTKRS